MSLITQAHAEVPDPDDSVAQLAQAIAESGGGQPDQYQQYAEKLARTLTGLSPEQQMRVFGAAGVPGASGSGSTTVTTETGDGSSGEQSGQGEGVIEGLFKKIRNIVRGF